MRYQVGRAEHPDASDERFDDVIKAIKAAQFMAIGDYVIAVWEWQNENIPAVVCLIYGGEIYRS